MTATMLSVSNKFGFLNISDSDEEIDDKAWLKAKKTSSKNQVQVASKKKPVGGGKTTAPTNTVVGAHTAPSQNIINAGPGQGLSKNAKRRLRKKKQAAEAAKGAENGVEEEEGATGEAPPPSEDQEEEFQRQLELAKKLSKQAMAEDETQEQAVTQTNGDSEANAAKRKKKKVKKPNQTEEKEEAEEEEEEEEEEDLFTDVIEDIKNVIKRISKEDDIPITDIPIDNNQLLRKRALELQEINSEFKLRLNTLLRVGYKYKRKYEKERTSHKQLQKVMSRCDSSKKADMVKKILQHEETEDLLTKQIEELSEELERERTKSHALHSERKGTKKVSFTDEHAS